jgi:redox-sensitive bicupin YhaK (pirin superfamily)
MEIKFYPKETQLNGNFNNGSILEKKPIGFPNENGKLKPFSNIFYWAHAWTPVGRSTIGLHPHHGFEICTFVLKGNINHFDTKLNKWVKLNQGDVQIIRSGNGISHSEEILENTEIFQIWFDPDLSKSLKRSATYNDYKGSDFKKSVANGVKIIKIHESNKSAWMDSEGVSINDLYFETEISFQHKIEKNKIHSFFLIDGHIFLGNKEINKGDFFTVKDLKSIQLNVKEASRLFEVSSPVSPSYKTYFN